MLCVSPRPFISYWAPWQFSPRRHRQSHHHLILWLSERTLFSIWNNTSTQICRSWSVRRKRKHARYTNQLTRLNPDKALNLGVYFHRFPLHDFRRSWVSLLYEFRKAPPEKTNQTEGARGLFMRPVIFHLRRLEGCRPRYASYLWTTDTHIHPAINYFLYM